MGGRDRAVDGPVRRSDHLDAQGEIARDGDPPGTVGRRGDLRQAVRAPVRGGRVTGGVPEGPVLSKRQRPLLFRQNSGAFLL